MTNIHKRPKRSNKRSALEKEKALEAFLFGDLDTTDVQSRLGKELDAQDNELVVTKNNVSTLLQLNEDEEEPAFFVDTNRQQLPNTIVESKKQSHETDMVAIKQPRWIDNDNNDMAVDIMTATRLRKLRKVKNEDAIDGIEYEERLRQQFEKINPTPKWAMTPSQRKNRKRLKHHSEVGDQSEALYLDEESQNDDDALVATLLQTTSGIIDRVRETNRLSPERIEVVRMKNANIQAYNSSVVSTCRFHPFANIMMTAGLDKAIRLFQVDGKNNPKLHSIYIKDLPIAKAAIHPNGTMVTAVGFRPYYYMYDLEQGVATRIMAPRLGATQDLMPSLAEFVPSPCGKYFSFVAANGYIVLVDSHTHIKMCELKMNEKCQGVAWSSDSSQLLSIDGRGDVYTWNVGMQRCVSRWQDKTGFENNSIAISPNVKSGDSYIAIGSYSGVVNIYSTNSITNMVADSPPKPLRSILNLTTPISSLAFNHDGQVLAISSRFKKDQFRLVHLPSCRVFPNWPTSATPSGYMQCVDFSPHSGYLSLGTDKGKVLLYRLKNFQTY